MHRPLLPSSGVSAASPCMLAQWSKLQYYRFNIINIKYRQENILNNVGGILKGGGEGYNRNTRQGIAISETKTSERQGGGTRI